MVLLDAAQTAASRILEALSESFWSRALIAFFITSIPLYLIFTNIFNHPSIRKSADELPPPTKITGLRVYPVKSCHGIEVSSTKLLPTGLDLDRQWMFVSYPKMTFLTIRSLSKMTLIRPTYDAETDTLTITAPDPSSPDAKIEISIPAHPTRSWLAANTSVVPAKVWQSTTPAHCYSPTLTEPFNAFFRKEVRLVYKPPVSDYPRALTGNAEKSLLGRAASTCFADAMPVLVGCDTSIAELNERLSKVQDYSIDIVRFRPNILVQGHEPWSEERWKTVHITPAKPSSAPAWKFWVRDKTMDLDVVSRCARCQVPNVDPETAQKSPTQPWDTLMQYRVVDSGQPTKPCFGMYCVPRQGGVVEVGMHLEISEVTDDHRYLSGM